jgi:hypothetical protein
MEIDKFFLECLVTVDGITTKGKFYHILGETENYFVIKNDMNRHECVKKTHFRTGG